MSIFERSLKCFLTTPSPLIRNTSIYQVFVESHLCLLGMQVVHRSESHMLVYTQLLSSTFGAFAMSKMCQTGTTSIILEEKF